MNLWTRRTNRGMQDLHSEPMHRTPVLLRKDCREPHPPRWGFCFSGAKPLRPFECVRVSRLRRAVLHSQVAFPGRPLRPSSVRGCCSAAGGTCSFPPRGLLPPRTPAGFPAPPCGSDRGATVRQHPVTSRRCGHGFTRRPPWGAVEGSARSTLDRPPAPTLTNAAAVEAPPSLTPCSQRSVACARHPPSCLTGRSRHGEGVGDDGTIQAIQVGEQFASPCPLLGVLLALR